MWGSARPLAGDSWQLRFILYQPGPERLVVFDAVPCPSPGNQVIREHRLHRYRRCLFLYVQDENGDRKSEEVTIWKLFRVLITVSI